MKLSRRHVFRCSWCGALDWCSGYLSRRPLCHWCRPRELVLHQGRYQRMAEYVQRRHRRHFPMRPTFEELVHVDLVLSEPLRRAA